MNILKPLNYVLECISWYKLYLNKGLLKNAKVSISKMLEGGRGEELSIHRWLRRPLPPPHQPPGLTAHQTPLNEPRFPFPPV